MHLPLGPIGLIHLDKCASTHLQSSHFLQKNIKKCHVGKIQSQWRLWEVYYSIHWYSNNCLSLKLKQNKYNFMGLLGQRHWTNY